MVFSLETQNHAYTITVYVDGQIEPVLLNAPQFDIDDSSEAGMDNKTPRLIARTCWVVTRTPQQ